MPRERKREAVVVVGNGMVSHRFCASLTAGDGAKRFEVTVLGEEPRPAYDRVNLTTYFDHDDPDALLLAGRDWYLDRGITLHTGDPVVRVEREQRLVYTASGNTSYYDTLVFATGSQPHVPAIDGTDLPGVFVYRTIEDIENIREYSSRASSAAVMGGGLLGLEAADVLRRRGLETHVVQNADLLMSRQLNQAASAVLEREVTALGLRVHLKKRTARILAARTGRLVLEFTDGTSLEIGVLVIAAGIRPRDEIASEAGLELGVGGGIIVDDQLCTADPRIFAIGECALHRGRLYGLVGPGYEMADVLARQLREEGDDVFDGWELYSRLKVLGVDVATFGDHLGSGHQVVYKTENAYRMLTVEGTKIMGGIVVGDWSATGALQVAVRERRRIRVSEEREFSRTGKLPMLEIGGGVADWPVGAVVCNCTNTTRGQLTACVGAGCTTVEKLAEATGASEVCGSCGPLLAQLVGADGSEGTYVAKGRPCLVAGSIVAVLLVLMFALIPPIREPGTVQTFWYGITQLWESSLAKQISGFTLVGLSTIALLLPLRKRIRGFRFMNFGLWRAAHAILGALCLVGLVAHTGLQTGSNMDLWLMACFLGLNTAGAVAGLTIAMEDCFSGPIARRIRSLVTKTHIVFFWPYPVLLGFHILKVYLY